MLNSYETKNRKSINFKIIYVFLCLLKSVTLVNAQKQYIGSKNNTNSDNTQNNTPPPPIVEAPTPICVGSKTELSLSNSCTGTVIWKTSTNLIVGKGNVLSISPKITTNYTAICKVDDIESKPSNVVTVIVNAPKFRGCLQHQPIMK